MQLTSGLFNGVHPIQRRTNAPLRTPRLGANLRCSAQTRTSRPNTRRRSAMEHAELPGAPAGSALQCLVKLGGAAITVKDELETVDTVVLPVTVQQLADVNSALTPGGASPLLVVHGAGSFGHFQASQTGVSKGGLGQSNTVRDGFVATRLSVTKLNHLVCSRLAEAGLPAVGLGGLGGWTTERRKVSAHNTEHVRALLGAGLMPVVHGDCVLDSALGCTILSGDTIMEVLAKQLRPHRAVFLTNVDGVFTKPPEEPGAQLIEEIHVDVIGSWEVARCGGSGDSVEGIDFSCSAHDSTGGLETKVQSAVDIAATGVDVFIAKAGSTHALTAMQTGYAEGWVGTWVRLRPPV